MPLIFILLFSFNNVVASEFIQYSQEKPIQLAEKSDTRRRGGVDCGTPPDVWAISMCKTESFCYTDPQKIVLWLPYIKRTDGSNFVTIEGIETQQKITKRWQISDMLIPWPIEEIPPTDKTNYLITLTNRNGVSSYSLILNAIPSTLSTVTQQINWMKENGCTKQADMLLNKPIEPVDKQDTRGS
ncbi:MAG: hypothetical protein KAG43_07185 [Candidatus Marithrix sp.]|nr:hypothetical protein [Candidatus Marithrix sp.]